MFEVEELGRVAGGVESLKAESLWGEVLDGRLGAWWCVAEHSYLRDLGQWFNYGC